ncbi:hypothetical protein VCHA49P379_230017 [Vibrio chagasii]|nr:hypothetical protein VCHA49P379_230017 [Vibrio chagasii]
MDIRASRNRERGTLGTLSNSFLNSLSTGLSNFEKTAPLMESDAFKNNSQSELLAFNAFLLQPIIQTFQNYPFFFLRQLSKPL